MERSDTLPRSGSDAADDAAAGAGADDPNLVDREASGDGRKRRRKRNSKNPDTLLIEALSSVVISTEAQIKELSAQQERLKAQHDALCGAITCLEGLIYATRPLRRAARRAARGGDAEAAAAADAELESEEEEWSELRELFRELREQPGAGGGGGGAAGTPLGGRLLSGSVNGCERGPPLPRNGSTPSGASERSSSPGGSSGDGSCGGSDGTGTPSGGAGTTAAGATPRRTVSGSATPAAPGLLASAPAAAAAAVNNASPGIRAGSADGSGPCSGIGPPPRWAKFIGNDDPDGAFAPGAAPSSVPCDPGGKSSPSGGSGSGGGPDNGGGGGSLACPVSTLARMREMTAPDVARRVQRYVHVCSVDLLRVKGGARDAAAAEARLAEQLDRLMAFSGALLVANPMVLGAVAVYRLDTLQPYGEADTPTRDLWRFALKQAGLTRRQELSMSCLLQLYKSRLAALIARRGELLAMQSSHAHDTEAESEVLALLEQLQLEYSFTTLAFPNALYSCILKPHQAAAIWAGAFPYIPQLLVLDQALCSLQAEAATAQAFQSPAALPPLPPASQYR